MNMINGEDKVAASDEEKEIVEEWSFIEETEEM